MTRNERHTPREGVPRIVPANTTPMYGSMGAPMDGPPPVTYHDADAGTVKLQELVDINVDSSRSFDEAAELVSEQRLVDLFRRISDERSKQAEELARIIADRGDQPDAEGTLTNTLQRAWVRLKAAISDDDEGTILEETESIEDQIKERYEEAMGAKLPDEVRDTLARHQQAIHASHAQVRDLRDRHRAEAD